MTFFERQQLARRQSRILLVLFAAAVAGIVVALDVVGAICWIVWRWYEGLPVPGPSTFWGKVAHVPVGVHLAISVGTLLVIFAVSALKGLELRRGGGAAVARMMGGRGIGRGTTDPLERRLLNVVEEMAIASGTRLPLVYVMDKQRGINAFTAGDEVSLAAICVTRGALELLTRDELQAIVAHEFSHIVNGDMALNMRIIGVLAGIVFIGAAGQFVMRGASQTRDARALPVALVGFLVLVIGSIGLFFSRVIKSMLAREREKLADAGGVQYTRHPESLAGALDQVRANYSWVSALHTEDVSHLFFANPHGFLSEVLFATHPPIEERIRAIDARFASEDYRRRRALAVAAQADPGTPRRYEDVASAASIPWRLTATEAVALVGTVQAPHLESARRSLRAMSPELRSALDDAQQVAGVVLALLLARDEECLADATRALEQAGLRELARSASNVWPLVRGVPPERQLAVVDLALPSLRIKPESERADLVRALEIALATDRKLSFFGFAFVTFVRSQLAGRKAVATPRYRMLAQLRDEAAVLISLFAHAGCGEPATLERDFVRAFEAGAVAAGLVGQIAAVRRDDCTPEAASNALKRLQELAPLDKARLVKALFASITADGVLRPVEVALLRMVGGVLDCPLPPLMDGQPQAEARTAPLTDTAAA
jgi:Zn-dependent protease with chaperone function